MTLSIAEDTLTHKDREGVVADVDPAAGAPAADETPLVEEDLLVEDVSIDGMCGVY